LAQVVGFHISSRREDDCMMAKFEVTTFIKPEPHPALLCSFW